MMPGDNRRPRIPLVSAIHRLVKRGKLPLSIEAFKPASIRKPNERGSQLTQEVLYRSKEIWKAGF
jgi:hypothetical protein